MCLCGFMLVDSHIHRLTNTLSYSSKRSETALSFFKISLQSLLPLLINRAVDTAIDVIEFIQSLHEPLARVSQSDPALKSFLARYVDAIQSAFLAELKHSMEVPLHDGANRSVLDRLEPFLARLERLTRLFPKTSSSSWRTVQASLSLVGSALESMEDPEKGLGDGILQAMQAINHCISLPEQFAILAKRVQELGIASDDSELELLDDTLNHIRAHWLQVFDGRVASRVERVLSLYINHFRW